ncbi:MAG: DUF2851 family protein [Planctomycetes bacterium]|nr:DUF2851 family protein [Planctomycetota bacterium]
MARTDVTVETEQGASRVAMPRPRAYGQGPAANEYLVHCIWFDQRLRAEGLATLDGRRVRVLTPGHWSLDGGPDFRGAVLELGGERVVGDVEVHLSTGDWWRHGHDRQAAYAGVALHVALRHDRAGLWAAGAGGRLIPQLVLEPWVEPPASQLAVQLSREGYPEERFAGVGLCHGALLGRRSLQAFVGRFLDRAGDVRFAESVRRLGRELDAGASAEEVFHRGLFEALGYRGNVAPFRRLAETLPASELLRLAARFPREARVAGLEAVLLDRAGLLPDGARGEPEAAYARAAREALGRAGTLPEPALSPEAWALGGLRPANAPARRLAGAARLLAGLGEGAGLYAELETKLAAAGPGPWPRRTLGNVLASLEGRLVVPRDGGFWSRRHVASGSGHVRGAALIGRERARLMLLNVFLPLAAAHGARTGRPDLAAAAGNLCQDFPALGENHLLRFGRLRLFGPRGDVQGLVTTSRRQQGLLEMFHTHCDQGLRGCESCPLYRALSGAVGGAR